MSDLRRIIEERILVLDGGLGTMIQRFKPDEAVFRGEEFKDHRKALMGCNDLLALTAPEIPGQVHRSYLQAGADIVSTDSFNSNTISLGDFGLEKYAYRISRAAAEVARAAADEFTAADPGKPRFVAGSIGPGTKCASLPLDYMDMSLRSVTFDELVAAYAEQVKGLREGGVDLFIVETFVDTLNAKAALFAIEQLGGGLPVIVSATLTDLSGRTLSAQTIDAFCLSVAHAKPLAVGINCGLGAEQMRPHLELLARVARCGVSLHPNAGLPNAEGGYDEAPEAMAAVMEGYMAAGLVNIVGGCCGTVPEYVAALEQASKKYAPRAIPEPWQVIPVCGLEAEGVGPQDAAAALAPAEWKERFAQAVRAGEWDAAVDVLSTEADNGAKLLEIRVDGDMTAPGHDDPAEVMVRVANLVGVWPQVARLPLILVSDRWEILEAGIKCVQGRSYVRLTGEAVTPKMARIIEACGAAVI